MKGKFSSITIGVSGSSPQSKSVRSVMKQIRDEGCEVIFLQAAKGQIRRSAERDIRRINALVMMGNNYDIDPKLYIERCTEKEKRCIHPSTKSETATLRGKARANYEELMLAAALKRKMPILGICGGMQRLNVLCGGTLHQHIPDLVGCDKKHMQSKKGLAPHIPVLPILIKDHTMLANIANAIRMPFVNGSMHSAKVIMENSLHHQSVDRLGKGLRICALTDTVRMKDGTNGYLIEAIESDPKGTYGNQFILGVQWHPEFGASSLGEKIIQRLIASSRQFIRTRATPHAMMVAFQSVRSIQLNAQI